MRSTPPSLKSQERVLNLLRTGGLVLAGPDHRVLRYLELRRYARALPLFDPRAGKPVMARAWQITDAGIAAALRLAAPAGKRRAAAEAVQIDLEDAIASSSSGGEPDAAPLTDPDARAFAPASVSAPEGRMVETPGSMPSDARGRKPETAAS